MALTLKKVIPARIKTVTAKWVQKQFMTMSPEFRAIRAKCKSPMGNCYWCGHAFFDGEMMALACFNEVKIGNSVLCSKCCDLLIESDKAEGAIS